ncbi:MAG: DUF7133 domain-containing protein, partial [Verrucomicrobiales bacterium]
MYPKYFLPLIALALLANLGRAVTITSVSADQEQAGNPARHAFDSDPNTRWSADGRGRWIQFELSEPSEMEEIGIGFFRGGRDYAFAISTSGDGSHWQERGTFHSGGRPGVIRYQIPPVSARFGRITVDGSDANGWANIHTIEVPGAAPPDPPATEPQAGGIEVTEWASDSAIKDSVGISLDDHGRAYVTVVERRKQSSLDIRNHQNLVKKDLSLTSVEERRAWYHEYLDGQSWLPDRNRDGKRDWQDLTVQRDNVTIVSDSDGDGRADSLRRLKEFHSEVTGIVAGVLAVGDDVYVAAEPDFLRYTDDDGDGFPESEQLIATGMQVHMGQGGHNLSGAAVGPDGRIYWSLADKGHSMQTGEGKQYHAPNSGAIFRCEMDGSEVERFSTGERNAQELAFDAFGNLFSMDNDGDYPGEKERALYITEGSEHGWRFNWQWLGKQEFTKISGIAPYNPWMEEGLFLPGSEEQAAYITPTIGNFGPGPCGFAANPGTALGPRFTDCFFMTNQKGEVRVFKFAPDGASFSFEEQSPISGGLNNTGLAFGPDGALYAASYGSGNGSIFRFDVPAAERHPARGETREILATQSGEQSLQQLRRWLDHPDQRVRMKGQFELARRGVGGGGFAELQKALTSGTETRLGKLHAIWGIGQIARRDPAMLTFLMPAWNSGDAELIAQCAKVTGDTEGGVANHSALLAGLHHDSPRVRFFCAIAAGKRGYQDAVPGLIQILENDGASDPYLRHAATMGLAGTMPADQLAGLSSHPDRSVRLGAIVALRKLGSAEVSAFLNDADELVVLEAARAIHDDASISAALPALAALLERDGLENEALMRRVINAAFRSGTELELAHLVAYLEKGEGSLVLRRTALACILWWSQPPVLDAVEGRYRKHAPRDASAPNAAVAKLLPLIEADEGLREVLLNGVAVRRGPQWLKGKLASLSSWSPALQPRLLTALATINAPGLRASIEEGLSSPHARVREAAREHAAQAGIPLLDTLLAILDDAEPAGQGRAVLQLAKLDSPGAKQKISELAEGFRAGEATPEWKLELWEAAKSSGIKLPESPDRFEFGGDPERGKRLVFKHAAAQCIRCHMIGDVGSNLGPDLSKIGAKRTRAHLVTSMLAPNREISDGFGTVLIKL